MIPVLQIFAIDAGDERGESAEQPPRTRVSDWSDFPLGTLGDSAMHAAAWNGSLGVMRFLLEQGQRPDARDNWQMTPLMVTIMRHALPLIRSVFRGREAIPRHLAMDVRALFLLLSLTNRGLTARKHTPYAERQLRIELLVLKPRQTGWMCCATYVITYTRSAGRRTPSARPRRWPSSTCCSSSAPTSRPATTYVRTRSLFR